MERFQLELIYYFTYFSTVIPSNCPSQETEETSTSTRPFKNFVLTTKGLQERNRNVGWDDGEKNR